MSEWLYLHRSEPVARAVLGDWLEEQGRGGLGWLKRVAELNADAAAAADAAADAAAADAADAADAAADADAEAISNTRRYWRVEDMREGLLLIQVPGRYWGVTRVGWARRVEGDEWEWRGVTVVRTGAVRTLASLAFEGPMEDHDVTPMDETTELLHRFSPRRVLLANPEVWGKPCPKPEGW